MRSPGSCPHRTVSVDFTYAPATRTVTLPDQTVRLNEYGWEITPDADQPPPTADE